MRLGVHDAGVGLRIKMIAIQRLPHDSLNSAQKNRINLDQRAKKSSVFARDVFACQRETARDDQICLFVKNKLPALDVSGLLTLADDNDTGAVKKWLARFVFDVAKELQSRNRSINDTATFAAQLLNQFLLHGINHARLPATENLQPDNW